MGRRTRSGTTEIDEDVDDTSDEVEAAAEPEGDEGDGRRSRVMRFAKRLMDRRELSADTREILGSVLATSDKAKNEAVKMVAREVRSYLDALELKKDLKDLVTSYSLEISLSLKPLERALQEEAPAPTADPEAGLDDE